MYMIGNVEGMIMYVCTFGMGNFVLLRHDRHHHIHTQIGQPVQHSNGIFLLSRHICSQFPVVVLSHFVFAHTMGYLPSRTCVVATTGDDGS